MIKDIYDIEQIKSNYNDKLKKIKQAIIADDDKMLEDLLTEPLYDDVDEIPKMKHTYMVTLKRVMTYTQEVEAENEDDAIYEAECNYKELANMKDWECDEELDPDVECLED